MDIFRASPSTLPGLRALASIALDTAWFHRSSQAQSPAGPSHPESPCLHKGSSSHMPSVTLHQHDMFSTSQARQAYAQHRPQGCQGLPRLPKPACREPHDALAQEQERTCWSCHTHVQKGGLMCRGCDKIQPVDSSLNYFDLLGV